MNTLKMVDSCLNIKMYLNSVKRKVHCFSQNSFLVRLYDSQPNFFWLKNRKCEKERKQGITTLWMTSAQSMSKGRVWNHRIRKGGDEERRNGRKKIASLSQKNKNKRWNFFLLCFISLWSSAQRYKRSQRRRKRDKEENKGWMNKSHDDLSKKGKGENYPETRGWEGINKDEDEPKGGRR